VTALLRARGPYSLADSAWGTGGGTRRRRDGVLEIAVRPGGVPGTARVAQRADGAIAVQVLRGERDVVVDAVRECLLLDVDTTPFVERARRDPLLGRLVARRPGLRPVRRGTVSQAIVAALAGQLVTWREAVAIESRVVARASPREGALRVPPTRAELAALSPAQIAACGMAASRAAALVRVLRTLDPEALAAHDSAAVAARLGRERGLGPWSAGVVGLYGLGRLDLGLVGDLGLLRVASRLSGRRADVAETAALLAPHGEWAGLASLYLLSHPWASVPAGRG
jgi:DNA-3-methyladenine glycosylase II